jgi:hypothetical protein
VPAAPEANTGADVTEPPPVFEGEFAPYSNTAISITDTVTFNPDAILFGVGHVYETELVRFLKGNELLASMEGAGTAASLLGLPETGAYELRKVTAELVNAKAKNGGLCNPEATTFILLGADYPVEGGTKDIALASFQGTEAPGPTTAELKLCGTFRYGRSE